MLIGGGGVGVIAVVIVAVAETDEDEGEEGLGRLGGTPSRAVMLANTSDIGLL